MKTARTEPASTNLNTPHRPTGPSADQGRMAKNKYLPVERIEIMNTISLKVALRHSVTGLVLAIALIGVKPACAGLKGVGTGLVWDSNDNLITPPYLPAAINNLQGAHGITWWYNWSIAKNGSKGNGEFIPMVWKYYPASYQADVNTAATTPGASAVLAFNEPEVVGQAQMTVDAAITNWPTFQAACIANGKRIGSPAVGDSVDGHKWIDDFMAEIIRLNYRVDFICFHPYQSGTTPVEAKDKLVNKLAALYDRHKKPIWVTEIAMADWQQGWGRYYDQATQATFARLAINAMETLPYVERYAWYEATPIETYTDIFDNTYTSTGLATTTSSGTLTQVGTSWRDNWGSGNWFTNPGFENGFTMSPWLTWSNNGTASAAHIALAAAPAAHTGMYLGTIYSPNPYFAVLYQNATGLPNGSYSVGAWVNSGGGQDNSYFYVKRFSNLYGTDEIKRWIPANSNWNWIQISNIPVSTGRLEIGFVGSSNSGGKWMNVDDTAFWKN